MCKQSSHILVYQYCATQTVLVNSCVQHAKLVKYIYLTFYLCQVLYVSIITSVTIFVSILELSKLQMNPAQICC